MALMALMATPLGNVPSYNVLGMLAGYQTGMRHQVPRSWTGYLQQTYMNQQLLNLEVKPLADAQKAVADKAFCSVWLNSSTVLVGTKCNSLLAVQPQAGSHTVLQYPQQPLQREGPDLLAASAGISCGQHALALSPSGRWLLTGGQSPQDILLWHVVHDATCTFQQQQQQQQQQLESMQQDRLAAEASSPVSSPVSRTALQPVRTLMGHADWVFDLAWLDDSCFVSAGRDRTIKLWQVPQNAAAAAAASRLQYTADPAACQTSVTYHKDKVRCIKHEQQRQVTVSVSVDGTLGFWTPELQLYGGCELPYEVQYPQALLLHGSMVAVGAVHSTELLDSRTLKPVARVAVERSSKRRRVACLQEGRAAPRPQQPVQLQQWSWPWQPEGNQQQRDLEGVPCVEGRELPQDLEPQLQQEQQQEHHQQANNTDEESWAVFDADGEEEQQTMQLLQQALTQQPLEQLSQGRLLMLLHMALELNHEQLAARLQALVPAEVYYAVQRSIETQQHEHQAHALQGTLAAAQGVRGPYSARTRQQEQHGRKRLRAADGAGAAAAVQAEVVCSIAAGQHGVRSLSLHHHLLGIGTGDGQLCFHDMRRLSSSSAAQALASHSALPVASKGANWSSRLPAYDMSWVPGSWGAQLPARVGCLGMPDLHCRFSQVLGAFGFSDINSAQLALYTHCWDPTGTQVFLGGGPLQLGFKGCALALYSS